MSDYRRLLVKYMAEVMYQEGISYIIGPATNFTQEESRELKAIEAEAAELKMKL